MRSLSLFALSLVLVGCPGPGPGSDDTGDVADTGDTGDIGDTGDPGDTGDTADTGVPLPEFLYCHDASPPTGGTPVDWEHFSTRFIVLGDPDHSAQDVLITDAVEPHVPGKFAYGLFSKDLEDEWVEIWVDDCSGSYVQIGEQRTDDDGRIDLSVPAGVLPSYGSFGVFLRVKGDLTSVTSTLSVYPEGTILLVTDIDGTLTISDAELFSDIFADYFAPLGAGTYVPEARIYALEAMELRAVQGYVLVYLTGRPYWLTDITREWLGDLSFPEGTLHVADSNAEVLPTDQAVGAYKRDYLQALEDMGFVLDGAYGNATTDIYAYAQASIDPSRTWIAGDHGGESGTVDIGEDYLDHYADAAVEPVPTQPFVVVP